MDLTVMEILDKICISNKFQYLQPISFYVCVLSQFLVYILPGGLEQWEAK